MRVYDAVTRYIPWFFSGSREMVFHEPVPGYRFYVFKEQCIRVLLGFKNATVYIFESNTNLGYTRLLETLKQKEFIRSYALRRIYTDYPRYLSGLIAFNVDGRGKPQFANAMVSVLDGVDMCYSKMLGEALERHAGLLPEKSSPWYPHIFNDTPSFTYADIPQHTSHQKKVHTQFPQNSDPLSDIACVRAQNTTLRRRMPIPLQCAYYGFKVTENKIHEGTTNGCGGGFTYTMASLSAIYELIERDAFLLWWFSSLQPSRVRIDPSALPFFEQLLAHMNRYALEVYFLDTSYDVNVLSCVCVIIDPVLNIVSLGGKSGTTTDVFEGAYLEALQVLGSSRGKVREGKHTTDFFAKNDFTDALNQDQRETQVCTPEAIEYIRTHFLSGAEIDVNDLKKRCHTFGSKHDELQFLIAEFKRLSHVHGSAYNLYLYEFDSPWLRFCNYSAVRAFVPAFIKLHLTEYEATPVSPRLKSFMEAHGKEYSEDVINRTPHFFP